MISLFLIFISFLIVLGCLGLKLSGKILSSRSNYIVCVFFPVLCTFVFVLVFIINAVKRNAEHRELTFLLETITSVVHSNRVYSSNEEKYSQLNTLQILLQKVDSIARDDQFISLICGKNDGIENKINQTRHALLQNIKWLNRLNDLCSDTISYDKKQYDDKTIQLIDPPTDSLKVLNIAFKYRIPTDSVICTFCQVVTSDSVIYRQSYKNKNRINCFAVPHFLGKNETIELGYIKQEMNKKVFYYKEYGRK